MDLQEAVPAPGAPAPARGAAAARPCQQPNEPERAPRRDYLGARHPRPAPCTSPPSPGCRTNPRARRSGAYSPEPAADLAGKSDCAQRAANLRPALLPDRGADFPPLTWQDF